MGRKSGVNIDTKVLGLGESKDLLVADLNFIHGNPI